MTAPAMTKVYGGSGFFRIYAYHPNGKGREITTFRGKPSLLNSYSYADPFGDSSAVISLPAVTSFDKPGYGDLWWLLPYSKVTIFWYDMPEDSDDPAKATKNTTWNWEGYVASEEVGSPYQLQCKGALYQADNFLAAPFYPSRPLPYEILMGRMLNPVTRPSIGTKALSIEWPSDWKTTFAKLNEPSYLSFLQPFGVSVGSKWSGLTTRDTGSWNPILTGYIQNLLTTMFTPSGEQWTVMKKWGRVPVLRVRQSVVYPDEGTLIIYNEAPGVKVGLSRDFTQSANVVYGQGSDLNGANYSGAMVSADGETTWYQPYAALPQVYPLGASNPRYLASIPVKETRLTFDPGMDELSAKSTAASHLMRFADPGYTGTITMQSDPMAFSRPFNKFLIQAGQSVLLKNYRGGDLLLHITTVEVQPEDNTVSLTVDSKYRDALTVAQVRARTRDALDPVNLLKPGAVSVTVNDLVKPWSTSSGIIPSAGTSDATDFFKTMNASTPFPWTEWTTKYPPRLYPQYYARVRSKGTRAADRWQDWGYGSAKNSQGIPIKGAQSAEIRLMQIAAYDRNGNVLAIPFHISLYYNTVTVDAMPTIPAGSTGLPYPAGDRYPFFPRAFNQVKPTGEQEDTPSVYLPQGTQMVMGWGTFEEPAGYSPGSKGQKSPVTGKLVDEQKWSFDTTSDPNFDPYSTSNTAKAKTAGLLYAMIYQDAAADAYFLGRFYRQPPGT